MTGNIALAEQQAEDQKFEVKAPEPVLALEDASMETEEVVVEDGTADVGDGDDFFMGGGGIPGLDDDDENDNLDQRQKRKDLMLESFLTLEDLILFFGDVINFPGDYSEFDLDEMALIDRLLDNAKIQCQGQILPNYISFLSEFLTFHDISLNLV